MITAVIIDDEANGRLALREKLKMFCPEVEVLAEAENGRQGLELLYEKKPDLIFLDIEMPEMTGFEMLEKYIGTAHTIFTTAYDQYAIKAIKHGAFDYLLKPIDIHELKETIKKIISKDGNDTPKLKDIKANTSTRISISSLEGLKFLFIKDIVYLEADSNYTVFFMQDGTKIVSSKSLKEYEYIMEQNNFFRSHHSYIVNLACVISYSKTSGDQITMSNGATLDLSRRKKHAFLDKMSQEG